MITGSYAGMSVEVFDYSHTSGSGKNGDLFLRFVLDKPGMHYRWPDRDALGFPKYGLGPITVLVASTAFMASLFSKRS